MMLPYGHFLLGVSRRRGGSAKWISNSDSAFAERALGGDVSARAAHVRAAEALDLVLGLLGAVPVQAVHDRLGIRRQVAP